jgi:hypothetical protein
MGRSNAGSANCFYRPSQSSARKVTIIYLIFIGAGICMALRKPEHRWPAHISNGRLSTHFG